ncbi:FadD3 family acyl-CoA ligase [Nocardioides sp. R-C-SC26]|uniref:FadD3 family acyl-CoA ligase n=1 Tax=Nocardioides sp. R-C-SC26 TaxID=2870414 RepID=UPI001E4A2043|nr:FadD3 family acyl-CoA ligase [Nocardioides sp. R-C-SC26]
MASVPRAEEDVVVTQPVTRPVTLPGLVDDAAVRFGDHLAYVGEGRTLSYAGLAERVRSVARGYMALGAEPGFRAVIWAPNSIEWAVAALAVTYAGGIVVPANSRYTAHEVAEVIDRTGASLVVVADGFLGKAQIAELRAASALPSVLEVIDIVRIVGDLADVDPSAIGPDTVAARAGAVADGDVADILFTSGTTGRSKGAMSAHRQTIGVARAWAELGGVRAEDRYLVVNPFFHSFGYKIGIVVGLLTGATLYPVATFDLAETMGLIERERITVLPGAPTIYQSLLTAPDRGDFDLSSLRLAVTGAAVVPVVLIERMREAAPAGLGIDQVVTAFGMTEAVVVTMCREGDSADTVASTCGRAIPGMEIRIDGAASPGDEGELLVRGDFVMLGYLDDEEATAAAIDADGWLHTGDVGVVDEAGNLRITDRLKDMYISGGFNVYPAEIEQALMRLDGVDDVAVVGVPDERMGEVGKAFVVGSASADDVIAFARDRLANFKVPRHVAHVDVLPRNLGGKVLKNALRDAHSAATGK